MAMTDETTMTLVRPKTLLVIGAQSRALASALVRMRGNLTVVHATQVDEVLEVVAEHSFDHILVDNRDDGATALIIPRLARMGSITSLVVLAGPASAEAIRTISGVHRVFSPPFDAHAISACFGLDIEDDRKSVDVAENAPRRRAIDAIAGSGAATKTETQAPAAIQQDIKSPSAPERGREPGLAMRAAHSASDISWWAANLLPRLTPLFSVLYKNLALTVLAALFLAFIAYGVMIVFFLTSSSWSTPIALTPGHELVAKAERDLNELKVQRNLVSQQLSDATHSEKRSREALARAANLASIVRGTIVQERESRNRRASEMRDELESLREVIASIGSADKRRKDRQKLKSDYDRRLITRASYEAAVLSAAQLDRQIASMKAELSEKEATVQNSVQAVKFLDSLNAQLDPKVDSVIDTGVAELVPLSNQVIEVRQTLSQANAELSTALDKREPLENSLSVINSGIDTLETTPLIRSLEKPVTVLFVPYDNLYRYTPGRGIYSCAIAVFWCSRAGEIGDKIPGEIATTHPFFGKPMRGQFVEADLTDPKAALKEVLHAVRPPLFF